MLRTQIYLPEELRRKIDQDRAKTGESLAGYMRRAVEDKVRKRKVNKKSPLEVVLEALDRVNPEESGWKDIDVVKWQREIREDRF